MDLKPISPSALLRSYWEFPVLSVKLSPFLNALRHMKKLGHGDNYMGRVFINNYQNTDFKGRPFSGKKKIVQNNVSMYSKLLGYIENITRFARNQITHSSSSFTKPHAYDIMN